ncbi:hypothetical protein IE81DRAFT_320738 [Ceraceosorus guamensis]|uniref:Secreted protein n=1 Tax=Ceraceosorus guamensis TaxID=1522189 RepID=A0A316WAY7_9BASI|nr:hypothetical protein IE81DRAFT_320738 [Ceraceosorus guamensis]PWN45123.1 hypothetical protein IE81DRAFT_320738 [Ceraceosorus guamensis]
MRLALATLCLLDAPSSALCQSSLRMQDSSACLCSSLRRSSIAYTPASTPFTQPSAIDIGRQRAGCLATACRLSAVFPKSVLTAAVGAHLDGSNLGSGMLAEVTIPRHSFSGARREHESSRFRPPQAKLRLITIFTSCGSACRHRRRPCSTPTFERRSDTPSPIGPAH